MNHIMMAVVTQFSKFTVLFYFYYLQTHCLPSDKQSSLTQGTEGYSSFGGILFFLRKAFNFVNCEKDNTDCVWVSSSGWSLQMPICLSVYTTAKMSGQGKFYLRSPKSQIRL